MGRLVRLFIAATLCSACLALASGSHALNGIYASQATTTPTSRSSAVVVLRAGETTVLSIRSDYEGPREPFALLIPVPAPIDEEQVGTVDPALFDRLERLTAPRLVDAWEQDPCATDAREPSAETALDALEASRKETTFDRSGGGEERRFDVGEYDITVLAPASVEELSGWLERHGYSLPDSADAAIGPYIADGMRFVVATVDADKLQFRDGRAVLSPLRLILRSTNPSLPIRLGAVNSPGSQDLFVYVLGASRYEAAGLDNVTIPTNLVLADVAKRRFPEFYSALFEQTLGEAPRAAVTEYAWDATSCAPCPVPPLGRRELDALGWDAIGSIAGSVEASEEGDEQPSVQAEEKSEAADDEAVPAPAADEPVEEPRAIEAPAGASPSAATGVTLSNVKVVGGTVPGAAAAVGAVVGELAQCYDRGLTRNPRAAGTVHLGLIVQSNGHVGGAAARAKGSLDENTVACVKARARKATFAKAEGKVPVVELDVILSPETGSGAPAEEPDDAVDPQQAPAAAAPAEAEPEPALAPRIPDQGVDAARAEVALPEPLVLTRLHLRLDRSSLHSDLSLRAAEPIRGGVEPRPGDELESGARPAKKNRFQARYAIRHAYAGRVECDAPERGVWSDSPPGAGRPTPAPEIATDLAYVEPTTLPLARFTASPHPEPEEDITDTLGPAPGATVASGEPGVEAPAEAHEAPLDPEAQALRDKALTVLIGALILLLGYHGFFHVRP